MANKKTTENSNINNKLDEKDMLTQIANFCTRTKLTFDDLAEQINKIREFHTEKLGDKAPQFTTGTNRVEAIQNLEKIAGGLDEANKGVQEMLTHLKQMRSLARKPSVGLGVSGRQVEEEEEEPNK